MSITTSIKSVEDVWLNLLYENCKSEFSKVKFPSHDHNHHLRVWKYAKTILRELNKTNYKSSYDDIEACIISVFFHDIGLTKTINEIGHGAQSAKICKAFFQRDGLVLPKRFSDILLAITNHDDKKYKSAVYANDFQKNSVASILCVADDLDAFGLLGVLRYAEIYLLRGITLEELPIKVLDNLDTRYGNFLKVYGDLTNLVQIHKERYIDTRDFYLRLSRQEK